MRRSFLVGAFALATISGAVAQENFAAWEPLVSTFGSTGGGGVVIREYDPVVVGDKCRTNFTATEENGKIHRNMVEFDAVATQGGILCTNGRWRSLETDASGTTPFRVFFKDGVARRSP